MKNRLCHIIILVLAIFTLSACSPATAPTGSAGPNHIAQVLADTPKTVKRPQDKGVVVDAVVEAPAAEQAPVLLAERVQYTPAQLAEWFFPGENYTAGDYDTQGNFFQVDVQKPRQVFQVWLNGQQESVATLQDSCLNLCTRRGAQVDDILFFSSLEQKQQAASELPGFSAEQAQTMVKEFVAKLGLSLMEQPDYFHAFDHTWLTETRQELLKSSAGYQQLVGMSEQELVSWAAEDDFYYMVWQIQINGIPRDPNPYGLTTAERYMGDCILSAVVNKHGFARLQITGIYTNPIVTQQPDTLVPMEQALDTALGIYTKRYVAWLLDAGHISRLWKIALRYVPVPVAGDMNKAYLTPTWCFVFMDNENQFMDSFGNPVLGAERNMRINAITGEELP